MIRREINEGRMNCKAFWETKRLHMPSDLASLAKNLEVKRQKMNAINLLDSRTLEEK